MPPPIRVVPSLLCKSKADLLAKLRRLSRTTGGRPEGLNTSGMDAVVLEHARNATEFGSRHEPPVKDWWHSDMPKTQRVHVDIMDGKFVPNTSIPLSILEEPLFTQDYEVHLMVHNPLVHIKALARLTHKPVLAIIHREACRTQAEAIYLMQHLRSAGIKAGIAINPDTPLAQISTASAKADLVLIMTVHPGYSGQEFIASALPKMRNLRRTLPAAEIEVDGGIDKDTILMAAQAGANAFVASTAIFSAPDSAVAVRSLEVAAKPKAEAPTIRRGFGSTPTLRSSLR